MRGFPRWKGWWGNAPLVAKARCDRLLLGCCQKDGFSARFAIQTKKAHLYYTLGFPVVAQMRLRTLKRLMKARSHHGLPCIRKVLHARGPDFTPDLRLSSRIILPYA